MFVGAVASLFSPSLALAAGAWSVALAWMGVRAVAGQCIAFSQARFCLSACFGQSGLRALGACLNACEGELYKRGVSLKHIQAAIRAATVVNAASLVMRGGAKGAP